MRSSRGTRARDLGKELRRVRLAPVVAAAGGGAEAVEAEGVGDHDAVAESSAG